MGKKKKRLCLRGYKDEFKEGLQRNIYLIKFKTFQAFWEPCKHNQINWTGCRVVNFFSRLGFYLTDPLCIMAILTKEEKKETGVRVGHRRKMCFRVEEVCHLLIVRKVLNKKDLGAAESGLFQRGGVGLLFGRKAGQDSAREVCDYLKLLRGFFQGEEEVVYYRQ